MGKVWYAIKNIAMALAILFIGTAMVTMEDVYRVLAIVVGICFFIGGCNSFKETNMWISIGMIIVGIGIISLSETIFKDNDIAYYISIALVAVLAFLQLKKVFESYGRNTWQKILMKFLAIAYPVCIIAGSVFAVIQSAARATTFYDLGAFLWIVHTVLVLIFNKNFSGKKSNSSYSYSSQAGGASYEKVKSEMQSLATYFTGGFDALDYGVNINYKVNVKVSGETISFTVYGTLSGGDHLTETQANNLPSAIKSAFERRQKLIMNRASEKLENLQPNSDYSIEVGIGGIS